MTTKVLAARFLTRTRAEGPGLRSALWVQGCSLHCSGCFNPDLWGAHGGEIWTIDQILGLIPDDVEGLTLLGGEPFEQAHPLAKLAAEVQRRGMTVMTFTGYTLDELRSGDLAGTADLLAHTDLLVDGRFDRDHVDRRRPWVGSTNQRFRALTPRYSTLVANLECMADTLEIRVGIDGSLAVNGWADTEALDRLLVDLGSAPRRRHAAES